MRSKRPLAPGRTNVVAFEHLKHGAARVAHQDRRDCVAEDKCRHDRGSETCPPVFGEGNVTRSRQPTQFHGKQENQHDPEPEVRCRDSPKRKCVGRVVPNGIFLDGRYNSRGDTNRERNHDGHRGELDRHRQLLQNEIEYRYVNPHRLAKIAGEHAPHPIQVLNRNWPIEMILLTDLFDHGWVALFASHDQGRIAGQQLLQRDYEHRHKEQCRDQLQQPFAEQVQHGG